jgi:hypothetical protein
MGHTGAMPHLIGTWVLDAADERSRTEYGEVSLKFTEDGFLVYTIHSGEMRQEMLLTYRVEGEWLVTDQPSSPREERTRVRISEDGRLHLRYGEFDSVFVRGE